MPEARPSFAGVVGNRVLILVDGMRLNSGSYRLGPNQYLNTIDINQVDRIEVIRGAGSVLVWYRRSRRDHSHHYEVASSGRKRDIRFRRKSRPALPAPTTASPPG